MAYIDKMKAQDYIDQTRNYLNYLEEHIENVRKAFTEVSDACQKGGMLWVGDDYNWHTVRAEVIAHDLSKFSKEEFVQYRSKFYPVNHEDEDSFDAAWENHKKKNHHHHETAENYIDIIHMVIDWTAMGYKFGDTAKDFYEKFKDSMELSEDHKKFMCEIFDCIEKYRL